ncbi:MAG: thiamine ABC transporter substrate-binding protein [Ilumatobacteraceae bacterium]
MTRKRRKQMIPRLRVALTATLTAVTAACGGSDTKAPTSLTLIAYESFVLPEDAFDDFTATTGIEVRVALGRDAGDLLAKAVLTAGNPEGDVLWGVDNTLLSRAIDGEVFDPYVSPMTAVSPSVSAAGGAVVTPVDVGYVCVNYDIAELQSRSLPVPTTMDDLVDARYRDLLVVQNPAMSSPGLAFLLATVARYGADWMSYWQALVDNGVLVVDGWSDAYYSSFTRYGGDRPLVVSYSTSPPAEVLFADPPLKAGSPAPTGVLVDSCFEQIEFAGVLRGTDHVDAARQLVDYLVSRAFQELLPENLFVYPVRTDAEIPSSFLTYAPIVRQPLRLDTDTIAAGRQEWIDTWTAVVLGR